MSQASDQSAAVDVTCPGCFHPQTWDAAAACPICHFRLSSQGRSAALLPVGTQLKNYVVGEKLGQGGFGITYRGFDVTLKMKVAVKEYFPSEMVSRATDHQMVILSSSAQKDSFQYCREAFLKEAQTIAQIRHPHIVRVLNFFEMNGTAYLVMDYYEGQDLAHHLNINLKDQPSRKLLWREAVNLLLPVLDGLQRVHQAGYMHRDIKPGNLYLTEDGLILLDFGSARQVTGTHTGSLLIFSAGFSPYEQYIEGQLDRQGSWTDVYAIAATLYVMVTGYRLPSGLDRIQAQLRNQPDLLKPARFFVPEIPAALDAVLSRALAVEPDERTPAVGALKRELQIVLAQAEQPPVVLASVAKPNDTATTVIKSQPAPKPAPIEVKPPVSPPPQQPDKPPKANRGWVFLGVLLCGLFAATAGMYWWTESPQVQPLLIKSDVNKAAADKAAADKAVADKAAADKAVADKAAADKAAAVKAVARQAFEPELVRITGGCFQMGSPESESDRESNERQHQVCVKDFEIGKFEVTQAQWQAVMGNNPSYFQNCANCPVEQVSWNDVQDYLGKLNQRTGKQYRLPTEAEWEYAARAGTTTPFWTGRCVTTDQANYDGNYGLSNSACQAKTGVYREKPLPVGSFSANPWGLHDTMGNVWEWTCSVYDDNYGGAEQKCTNKNTIAYFVMRGGSWNSFPARVRPAFRNWSPPALRIDFTGFRLARSL